jgi:hypothetical protein
MTFMPESLPMITPCPSDHARLAETCDLIGVATQFCKDRFAVCPQQWRGAIARPLAIQSERAGQHFEMRLVRMGACASSNAPAPL